jgi:hypothetical protein
MLLFAVSKLSSSTVVSMLSVTSPQERIRLFLHVFSGYSDIGARGKFLEKHVDLPQILPSSWLNLKLRSECTCPS